MHVRPQPCSPMTVVIAKATVVMAMDMEAMEDLMLGIQKSIIKAHNIILKL